MIAKVEPLTPARALRGPFDYLVPERLGGVVGLTEESELPPERLVEPVKALDKAVPGELVDLGLWVAEEYCSTPARGLGLVLPPGTGSGADARRVRPLVELEVEATPEAEAA